MRKAVILAIVLMGSAAGCGGDGAEMAEDSSGASAAERQGNGDDGTYFYNWWTDNNNQRLVTFTSTGKGAYTSKWDFTYVNCGSYGTKCPRDFVGGKGWKTGSGSAVNYYATWSNSYGGCLGIYGWMTNPQVEYYVCDSTGQVEGPHNSAAETELEYVGELIADGATYKVYKNTRRGQPSIFGSDTTFDQYISVRVYPRTSGTITLQTHLDGWQKLGLKLGSMTGTNPSTYELLATEGWIGKGNSSVTLNPSGVKITVISQWPAHVQNTSGPNPTASCSVGTGLPASSMISQTCTWPLTVGTTATIYSSCGSTGKPTVRWTGCDSATPNSCTLTVKSTSAVTYVCD
jgi:endo-1,4-beta-xylanase